VLIRALVRNYQDDLYCKPAKYSNYYDSGELVE